MDERETMSEKLRVYRAKYRLSQSELASRTGLSLRLLSIIEIGAWEKISEKTFEKAKAKLRKILAEKIN